MRNFYEGKKAVIGLPIFLPFLITVLVYLPSLQNGFVNRDDGVYVYENQNIRSIDFGFLKWVTSAIVSANWHPLTMLSLAVDYSIWGLNPFGYHLTNIIFHALNTALLSLLLIRLINKSISPLSEKRGWKVIMVGIAALFFGVHPLHVESVAWISERKDVLCVFFFLLSIHAYLGYTAAGTNQRRFAHYALSFFAFILALMSKPMAVSLPIVLLILDFYPIGRLSSKEGLKGIAYALLEKVPYLILSLAISLVTIYTQHIGGPLSSFSLYPLNIRILNAVQAYLFYLIKMVFPLNLAPHYPYSDPLIIKQVDVVGSFIVLMAITLITVMSLKRNKFFFAAWIFYIVTLAPAIGLIKVGDQAMADRYTYLPSIGPFLLVGAGIAVMTERLSKTFYKTVAISVLMIVLGLLVSLNIKQIAIWQNSITLWTHEINIYPNISDSYYNRGTAYIQRGDYYLAVADFTKTIEIDRQHTHAYNNRGNAYSNMGNHQQAVLDFTKSIELNPLDPRVFNSRGIEYGKLGNHQQAINDFTKAIELNAKYTDAYYNRGLIYRKSGNFDQSITDFSKVAELNPLHVNAYYNLWFVYNQVGNPDQAIIYYRKLQALLK